MQERYKTDRGRRLASRRHAEEMIKAGGHGTAKYHRVGTKADPETDHIKVRGKLINPAAAARKKLRAAEQTEGYLSSVTDPDGRPPSWNCCPLRRPLYPVGRLDFNTEGLLLTNDGDSPFIRPRATK